MLFSWAVAIFFAAAQAAGLDFLPAAKPDLPPGAVQGPAIDPSSFASDAVVQTYLVPSSGGQPVAPGSDLVVAVVFDQEPGWHVHTNAPVVPPELGTADMYIRTAAVPSVPTGSPLQPQGDYMQWPEPVEIDVAFLGEPVKYGVFSGRAVAYLPVKIAADASASEAVLDVMVVYQACDDTTCKAPVGYIDYETGEPIDGQVISLPVTIKPLDELGGDTFSEADRGKLDALFAEFNADVWTQINAGVRPSTAVSFALFDWHFEIDPGGVGLILLLIVAGVGGFLLNFTPCVLPVIPIKILSLSQNAGSRSRTLLLGIAMSLGVVGFWMAIGGAIALLTDFDAINKLFTYNWFTIGVGLVIAAMAVGMCGLFAVRLPRVVYMVSPRHDSLWGSVGFGVMTAVLSTPCTAPFMGSAAAWATKQDPATTLATFAAIGLGMASPYLLLAAFPVLVNRMPRTGPASELIKQVMGLLMLAAAAYFLGVGITAAINTPPDPPSQAYWWVVAVMVAFASVWLIWRTWRITSRLAPRIVWTVAGVALLALAVIGGRSMTSHGPIQWVYYTPQRFAQAIDQQQVVVMDFTAEWCLNCKAMEKAVLFSDPVAALNAQPDITFMKVDITSKANLEGRSMLATVGRVAIPALVIFDGRGREVLNADFYTIEQVLTAVDAARDSHTRQAARSE